MKFLIYTQILTLIILSACSKGAQTVPNEAISPYSPEEPSLTYWDKIDPATPFMSNINLYFKRYMDDDEYKASFYGSTFFYEKSAEADFSKKLPENGACFQYLTLEEYVASKEEKTTYDQIFAGKVKFTSPNYQLEMPEANLSFGPGIATMGNYTANDEKTSIYIEGELFTGFGALFDFSTDDSDCLESGCISQVSVTGAFYFPDDFKLTPSANNYTKEISDSSGLAFSWENNNTITSDYDETKRIVITMVFYDENSQFSSYTVCSISDTDGKFDPSSGDSPFYQYGVNIFSNEKKPTEGDIAIERFSEQRFNSNDNPLFITIRLQEEFEFSIKQE